MSELAFSELETQVETLPYYQIVLLKDKIDKILEREKERESESFVDDGLKWLDRISGSVKRDIDFKKEREEWRDEKYGRAD